MKQVVRSEKAPKAIGPYSQAIKAGNAVYLSGQIALDPETMNLVSDDFTEQVNQVFTNLAAVAEAAGGTLGSIVKMMIYLTDMENFSLVNEAMQDFCQTPYPARACVAVKQLPKNALVEIDAVMILGE
jgi:reactive intermediate/imine deaminase